LITIYFSNSGVEVKYEFVVLQTMALCTHGVMAWLVGGTQGT